MHPVRLARSPRAQARRKQWLWRNLPYAIVILMVLFGFSVVPLVRPRKRIYVQYSPVRASNGLFVTLQSYLVENDDLGNPQRHGKPSEDLVLFFLGMGEFTKDAQIKKDEAAGLSPALPKNLICKYRKDDGTHAEIGPAYIHTNGTAFERSISSKGSVRYFGERALLISCGISGTLEAAMRRKLNKVPTDGDDSFYDVQLVSDDGFVSGWTRAKWHLGSSNAARKANELVLCSTALFNLKGARWLTEWLYFHRYVQGFTDVHIYVLENEPKTMKTIAHLAETHDWLTVHNWTSALNSQKDGFDPVYGVGRNVILSAGYEHAQRLARTDCYLRNRGKAWMLALDPDEYLYTTGGKRFVDEVSKICEPNKACRLTSVNSPPDPKNDKDVPNMRYNSQLCETQCKSRFNCGYFHFGREKYLIPLSNNSPMPWTILAIHSVSDSIPASERFGNVMAPKSIAFIKHFSPKPYPGGLPRNRSFECAFSERDVQIVESAVANDLTLSQLYNSPEPTETFLLIDAQSARS